MSLEVKKGINNEGKHTYNYITLQDIADSIKNGTITFDLPFYEEQEHTDEDGDTYSYIADYKESFVERLERHIKYYNEEIEKAESEDDIKYHASSLRCSIGSLDKDDEKFKEEGLNPESMVWIRETPTFKDYMTGESQGWAYLNIDTNTIALYRFDTKKKLVTQPKVFPNGKKITIDVPSGKLVFGYYDVFEPFQDRDEQREVRADYFDSERGKKEFFNLYQEKNIAMWYDGYFSINTNPNDEYDFRFVESCNEDYGTVVAKIEHDKCTCLVDMDTLLAQTKGTEYTFGNSDYKDVPFTEEEIIAESKVKSDYKALQIIDVPKGKYEITLVDYSDRIEVYEDDCPEDMKGYNDCLDYTLYGGMKLIEKY